MKVMIYGSVCSGIEAATVAWKPLGWKAAWFAEVDKFPSAVLAEKYPDVPNLGDMTRFKEWNDATLDVFVGGTPCQSFSVAGLRKGLDDPRGNLMLTYLAIVDRYRPRWLVWENVPGVLSSNGGRDFGTFLGGLGQLGYGFAYRVLDAQFFGVPQRRRRVFVVGYFGDWRRAAAVLFERHSLQGHTPPVRKTRETAPTIPSRRTAGGGLGTDFDCDGGLQVVGAMSAAGGTAKKHGFGWGQQDWENGYCIPATTHTLRGEGFDASEDGTGRGTPLVPVGITIHGTDKTAKAESFTDLAGSLRTKPPGRSSRSYVAATAVRRLTPRECERLQGFPDDYTNIPWRGKPDSPDGPRYKALGNSMAVPVMRWIGERIEEVDFARWTL